MRQHALYQGRFQPPTKAHYSTLVAILEEWERVTIGIIYFLKKVPVVDPKWRDYAERVRRPVASENPFSPEERVRLWEACLLNSGLSNRVSCTTCMPPHYDTELNSKFPPESVDYVLPKSEPWEEKDFARERDLPGVLRRPILFVQPGLKMHISDIRRSIVRPADWETHLAPGTVELFREMDGPARLTPSP